MAKTLKPSGLGIKRKGNKFTLTWKIRDKDYDDGQALQYRLNNKGKWHSVKIGKKDTSATIPAISLSNYYPTKKRRLKSVQIRVRGNRAKYTTGSGKKEKTHNPSVSDWSTDTFKINKPNRPTLSVSKSSAYVELCTFNYKVTAKDSNHEWFRSVEWQSILIKDCNTDKGEKLPWKTTTAGWRTNTSNDPSASIPIQENTATIASGSHTRWVRIRARGVNGRTEWTYAKYVYAAPNAPTITSATVNDRAAGGYDVTVKWKSSTNKKHPVKKQVVYYLAIKPDRDLACPSTDQWNPADDGTFKNASKSDVAAFVVPNALELDQCLYVKVVSEYDTYSTESVPFLAKIGKLKAPENIDISYTESTNTVTASFEDKSEVDGHFTLISATIPGRGTYYAKVATSSPVDFKIGDLDGDFSAVLFTFNAVVGYYTNVTPSGGVSSYSVDILMESEPVRSGAILRRPPTITAVPASISGTITVSWSGGYENNNSTEISWADHIDAWESTDEPSSYTVPGANLSQWNISGLETGKMWYIRARSIITVGDNTTTTAWSDIVPVDLASAPARPVLVLSAYRVTETGKFTASWVYSTTDGTPQGAAVLADVTIVDGEPVYTPIAEVTSEQQITLSVVDLGWQAGETHTLAITTKSASGKPSEWSIGLQVDVALPLTCAITASSLIAETITVDEESRTTASLKEMPLTITITGAGEGGSTSLAIVRAADYYLDRPDEDTFNGYQDETIVLFEQSGSDPIEISADDAEALIGHLDDGASYKIIATVTDGLGQKATAESITLADGTDSTLLDSEPTNFEVHWSHQAKIPSGTVQIENNMAKLTPVAPEETEDWQLAEGDRCDIYRLSVDKPVLLYPDAVFGTTYVDPYPALGEFGGHRFVFKSEDGDYITEDNQFAWYDTHEDEGDIVESDYNIIEWATGQVQLRLNIDLSHSWEKDFKETKYLGGSIQGDWNPAVGRDGSVKGTAIVSNDADTIEAMRRLATYPGICHIRTKDGSSFAANVDVSEDSTQDKAHKTAEYNLKITAVQPEGFDGLTLEEYNETEQGDTTTNEEDQG